VASAALRLAPKGRAALISLTRQRSAPQRSVRRAEVILAAAEGLSNYDIARRTGMARQNVIALRARFEERGIEVVFNDAQRPGRPPTISQHTVDAIVRATITTKPKHATHWSVRMMAAQFNVSPATVGRIWKEHHLQPHRVESFKFSSDPNFAVKVRDVVGLYMNPPRKALVLSVDEKSQIQALDRTAPILPMRAGMPERQTHDYWRNGTTTLFAALNVLDGSVIGKCLPRHRNEEFVEFLDHIDKNVAANLDVHLILDNYATHKHPNVKQWLADHPRYHVHFTPTSSSWINMVERFFGEITARRIRRGTFRSVKELVKAIDGYIADRNRNPKRFVWSAPASRILRKIKISRSIYETVH
jgi:transposase